MIQHLHAFENRRLRARCTVSVLALAAAAAAVACSGDVYYPNGLSGEGGTGGASNTAGTDTGGVGAGSAGAGSADTGGSAGADPAPPGGGGGLDCDVVKLQSRAILEKNCASCHGPGTNVGSFDAVLDVARLEATGKVVPGDPDGSPLYRRMSSGEMPPAAQTQRPNPAEIAVVYDWIESCIAPPGVDPPKCGEPVVDLTTALRAMIADISKFDLNDRAFIRYFTLNQVRNSGTCEDEMDIYRFALKKAVNALSQGTRLVAPEPIDQNNTIYRVDLRDYEWDPSGARLDKWEVMVANNPYAYELEEDDAEVLKDFTGTKVPFQAADWFVNQATQPPLYHEILDIPATRQELERQLGVGVAANIENGDVWRSGFLDSGVSAQNRVIERHELPVSSARTFWISYDFAGDGGRENIFANPLDFEPDGSEIIFTLPNGLHGYMVASAAGTRLDEAPDTIVVDPEQEDRNVRNGISCMSCHEVGMKLKEDELRSYVLNSSDFDVREKEDVSELHPARTEFEALVSRDSRLFVEALSALDPPVGLTTEPIIDVFHRFDANVDLKRAAAELGISPETLIRELGGLNPALAPLGYTTIKRETFRDAFAESVCLLNLGVADDPACD